MELFDLDEASTKQAADAVIAEYDRLCDVNGTAFTRRGFEAHRQHGDQRGIANVFGVEDRQFLTPHASFDSRLPAAQSSGKALPLHRAVELGAQDSLLQFMETNSSLPIDNVRNTHGETLLHTAVLHQHLEIVRTLLQNGADPNARIPSDGISNARFESVAPRSENYRCSRMLHAAEATPVHYACAVGNMDILKLMLSASRYFPQTAPFINRRAGSLLLWAITASQPEIAELLLVKKQLEADCFDETYNNCIGIAVLAISEPNQVELFAAMLKVLIRGEGVDINHKNMHGLTPYDIAESSYAKDLLARYGGHTGRVADMDKLLRWRRVRSREAYINHCDRARSIEARKSNPTS